MPARLSNFFKHKTLHFTIRTLETYTESAMRTLLIGLIRGYQYLISPILGNHCRFYPSCSHYAAEAIQGRGPVQGSWLAFRRLLRCHPWHPGGFDPVPGTSDETSHG